VPLPLAKEQQLDQLLAIRELENRGRGDAARAIQESGKIPDDLEYGEFVKAARAAYGPAAFYAAGGRDILPYVYDYLKETSIEDIGEDVYNFGAGVAQDIKENPLRTALDFVPYIGAIAGGGESFILAEQTRKAAERAKAAGDTKEYEKLRALAASMMTGALIPAFGKRAPDKLDIIQKSDRYKDVPAEQMTREMQAEAAMDTVNQALVADIDEFVPLAGAPKFEGPLAMGGVNLLNNRFAIFSAERGDLTPEENTERTRKMARELLLEFGPDKVSMVKGVYGSPERSFIVQDIDPIKARNYGDRYDQDSVFTDRGLIYSKGNTEGLYGQGVPIKPQIDSMGRPQYKAIIDPDSTNFFTDITTARGEPIRFRFDLEENEMFSLPSGDLTPSSTTGVQFSRQPNITTADPNYYGTGARGEESNRIKYEGAPLRTYFYRPTGDPAAVRPEAIVPSDNRYVTQLRELYDVQRDPEGLRSFSKGPTDLEQMIQSRGYRGLMSDEMANPSMGREGSALSFYREPVTSLDTATALGGLPPTPPPQYIQKKPAIQALGGDLNIDPRTFNAGAGSNSGVGRTRDMDRIRNLQVQYEDRRPSQDNIIRLQDFEGYPFVLSMSDRSMAGNRIANINGIPIGHTTRGGMGHMGDPLNADTLWRATEAGVTGSKSSILDMSRALTGQGGPNPLFLPVNMSPTGGDFSSQVATPMLKYNRAKLSDVDLDDMDADIAEIIPSWKGIRNDESLTNLYSATGDQRKAVLDLLDKKYALRGGLTLAEARTAATDTRLLQAPDGAVISAGRLDPERGYSLSPEYDVYPAGVYGSPLGNFDQQYQMFEFLPDIVQEGGFDPMLPPRNQLRKIETGAMGGRITEDILRGMEDRRTAPVSSETFSGPTRPKSALNDLLDPNRIPEKTQTAYKLFRTDAEGNLYPLFVNANQKIPMNEWLPAEAGEMTGNKVKSKIGPLAFRAGWHSGDLPIATHIGEKYDPATMQKDKTMKAPNVRPDNQVWAEVEMPADYDWQTEAMNRAERTKAGKIIPRTAHITDQVPYGGHYRYKTNPNMTGEWLIGGQMKVNRILSDDEVKRINDAAGVADLPRLSALRNLED